MSTLKPEELVEIIRGVYGSNPAAWPHTLPTFAAALEAELRKRWFAEPVAWKTANWPYGTTTHKHVGERWREEDGSVIALYAAPQDQVPT